MLKTPQKIRISLIIVVFILALSAIILHHKSYNLYRQSLAVNAEKQRLITTQKQLLADISKAVSGVEVQKSAMQKLQMRRPKKSTILKL